jgi:hypothetical protein
MPRVNPEDREDVLTGLRDLLIPLVGRQVHGIAYREDLARIDLSQSGGQRAFADEFVSIDVGMGIDEDWISPLKKISA